MEDKQTDFLGREVYIGDRIVFVKPRYFRLVVGTVVNTTPTGFTIKYEQNGRKYQVFRPKEQCIKFTNEMVVT